MLRNFKYTEGLLARYARLVCDTVVPYQEKAIRDEVEGEAPSHAIANFKNAAILNRTGVKPEGGDHKGCVFQDSDVAKWLEAAAYSLAVKPDAELEKRIDEVCELIEGAQEDDGYLDTHFTLNRPDKKFTDLALGHELYCAGHMIEDQYITEDDHKNYAFITNETGTHAHAVKSIPEGDQWFERVWKRYKETHA